MLRKVDSHCHLQLSPLFEVADDAISNCIKSDVTKITVCGTSPGNDWQRIMQLYERYPTLIIPNFGLHPWWIEKHLHDEWEKDLTVAIQNFPLSGVGECGLDKMIKKKVSMDMQEIVLRKHFKIALSHKRTLTLHCVSSWGRLYDVIVSELAMHGIENLNVHLILHSCNKMPQDMIPMFLRVQAHIFFSFSGGNLSEDVLRMAKIIPLDRLLIETDSPDQLPRELQVISNYSTKSNSVCCDQGGSDPAMHPPPSSMSVPPPPPTTCTASATTSTAATDITTDSDSDSHHILQFPFNQPCNVAYMYQKMSDALSVPVTSLCQICERNLMRAFRVT
jgi:TatD DNase family protein